MNSLATKEYWNKHWEDVEYEITPLHHPVRKWIEENVLQTTTATCIEIGCYPGKFLAVFGEKGYELNGIDFFSGTRALSEWFRSKGYRYGSLYENDFLTFKSSSTYDIVCSFGFIEHFENLQEILDKHLELLKPGGRIIVEVPNLNSPLYHFLYKIFEPDTLKNHVLCTMDLSLIVNALTVRGCKIEQSGFVGGFYFRFVMKHDKVHSAFSRIINFFAPLIELFSESTHRRYIGVIATKPDRKDGIPSCLSNTIFSKKFLE